MAGENVTIKVSAPGKVILHGEHSVVYGKLAIAASLDLRTSVVLQEKHNNRLEIYFSDLKLRKKFDLKDIKAVFKSEPIPVMDNTKCSYQSPELLNHNEYIKLLVQSLKLDENNLERNQYLSLLGFFYLYFGILHSSNVPVEALCITIKTELSLGAGTGSSASLMVSLAATLLRYLTYKMPNLKLKSNSDNNVVHSNVENFNELELSLISKWAFAAEKIIHGNPSGIDNTVCTYGSMVSFRKGRAPIAVNCRKDIRGLLVDTRVPKNTGVMVQKVSDLKKRRPNIMDSILQAMEDITDEALELLVHLGELQDTREKEIAKCYDDLGELSDLNQNLLRTLNVSHPALDDVIQIMNAKQLHGKLTGSGGGGYAISLIPPSVSHDDIIQLCEKLTAQGYQPLVTKLGGIGVRVD